MRRLLAAVCVVLLLGGCAIVELQRQREALRSAREEAQARWAQLDADLAAYNQQSQLAVSLGQTIYWNLSPEQQARLAEYDKARIKAKWDAFFSSLSSEQQTQVVELLNAASALETDRLGLNARMEAANMEITQLRSQAEALQRAEQDHLTRAAIVSNLYGQMMLYNALTQPQQVYVYPGMPGR